MSSSSGSSGVGGRVIGGGLVWTKIDEKMGEDRPEDDSEDIEMLVTG